VNEAVENAPALGRRSGFLALLLTYFGSAAGFAYVRKLEWGIAFALMPLVVMFIGGRLGVTSTVGGYYAVMSIWALLLIAGLVLAFRAARALPVNATPCWYNRWYHYVWIAAICVGVTNYAVRHRGTLFGYDMYRVPSTAMQPALAIGDFITVDARESTMATVHRGDIVTYVPQHHPDQTWIKRVVGLPGEHVVVKGNDVEIDGKPVTEGWALVREPVAPGVAPFNDITLGPDQFFLMGDNRPHSEDSRYTGPVPRDALRAKVTAIWFHYSPDTHSIDTSRIGPIAAAPAR